MATIITLRNGTKVIDPRLGRLISFDGRSKQYPIRTQITTSKPRSYTWSVSKNLDQKAEGSCVGFSWGHELIARPVKYLAADYTYARNIYKEAQKIDEWEGECVDLQTQCLTKDGWLYGSELKIGDEILSFNIDKEELEWAVVDKIHRYENSNYRVWSSKTFEVAVTDNHKWLVKNRNTYQPFELVESSNLKSQHSTIRACSALRGQPETSIYSDDFVQMVAWVFTEGYLRPETRRGTGVVVSQKHHKHSLSQLMARMNVAKGHCKDDGCHVWELSGDLSRQIREVAPERVPTMRFLLSLSKRQLRLFIDTAILGDGSVVKQENRLDRRNFGQHTGRRLDAFLAACVLAGIPVHKSNHNEYVKEDGKIGVVEIWSLLQSNEVETRSLLVSDRIQGPAWCPQTKNHTFVAKRNGTIWITGNSYEGTSIIAGAKIVQRLGHITEYRWAFGLEDLILAVGYKGPAVLGIWWYEDMFDTDANGFVHASGEIAGGHAILCYRVNLKLKEFSLWNSWGDFWGVSGTCKVSFSDMEKLLSEEGEACVPVKRLIV